MEKAGVSGGQLAHAIGIRPQNLTNLRRKPSSEGMRAIHLAHAADFLHCDLRWLCTGEGGTYVAAGGAGELTWLAREIAEWLDAMDQATRDRFYVMTSRIQKGQWPSFADELTRTAKS